MGIASSPSLGRWDSLDNKLLDYVVSRVLQNEPNTAVPLLQVNSTFHLAAAKALYEELYIQDDNEVITSPPPNTRHEAVLRLPKYASLVRTLVLIPFQVDHLSFALASTIHSIRPENLRSILESLYSLEAFVW